MNNRQKAKHFKRLYEQNLPQRKVVFITEQIPWTHIKQTKTIDSSVFEHLYDSVDTPISLASEEMARELGRYILTLYPVHLEKSMISGHTNLSIDLAVGDLYKERKGF